MTDQELQAALLRAADRIEVPGQWCRGTFARSRLNLIVNPKSPEAVAWCVRGAMYAENISDADMMNHATRINYSPSRLSRMNDLRSATAKQMAGWLRVFADRIGGKGTREVR